MNQLTVETRTRTINMLQGLISFENGGQISPEKTYRVVKFMVKVRLMEKSVKSHVGSVMVEKVMSQYKPRGTT